MPLGKSNSLPSDPGSDRSLVKRIQSGQTEAATGLYRRYARRIQALASKQIGSALGSRVEPEEIVQSVFRTFFRRLTEGHYDVPAGEELWGLFLVISLNKVREAARFHGQECRDVHRTQPLGERQIAAAAGPDEDLKMLEEVVEGLLAALPESHREVISMRIRGNTVAEIAKETGVSRRTTERVLQRFREKLSAEIDMGGTGGNES